MRKRFIARRNKSYAILKIVIYLLIGYLVCALSIKYLFKPLTKIGDEQKVNDYLAVSSNNIIGKIRFDELINFNLTSADTFLHLAFSNINKVGTPVITNKSGEVKEVTKVSADPLIYIYNTHQSEGYEPGSLKEYNIVPTVYMASFMLEKALAKAGIAAIVEEENISEVLKANNWKYSESYYASRLWLERVKKNYPTVKYFIDLHRDSVSGTFTIDDLTYAKLMLVVGMKHDNYQANESLALNLYQYLNTSYPGTIKNIFYGRNSKYNQDVDPGIFLVEVGGPNNKIDEVYNSVNILAEAIASVIGGL